MKRLTNKQKERIALAWITRQKTITQLMRQVYGAENRPHIYSIIAHGLKYHYQKRGD